MLILYSSSGSKLLLLDKPIEIEVFDIFYFFLGYWLINSGMGMFDLTGIFFAIFRSRWVFELNYFWLIHL